MHRYGLILAQVSWLLPLKRFSCSLNVNWSWSLSSFSCLLIYFSFFFCVLIRRVHIISTAPELPVLIRQFRIFFIYYLTAFLPLSIPWNWISTLLSKFLPAYVHYPDRSPPVLFLLFPKHTLFSRFSPLLISFLCRITFSCSSAQMLFGLNYTIYKNTRICLKKIFWVTIPWKGAPACSHIPYGCFTQNNFGYKDAKYLI